MLDLLDQSSQYTLEESELRSLEAESNHYSVAEALHLVLRLTHPSLKQKKFDSHTRKKLIFNNKDGVQNLLNSLNFNDVTQGIYKEVQKRLKLWGLDGEVYSPKKNPTFKTFLQFAKNTIEILSVREDPVLFRYSNEFFNAILK